MAETAIGGSQRRDDVSFASEPSLYESVHRHPRSWRYLLFLMHLRTVKIPTNGPVFKQLIGNPIRQIKDKQTTIVLQTL